MIGCGYGESSVGYKYKVIGKLKAKQNEITKGKTLEEAWDDLTKKEREKVYEYEQRIVTLSKQAYVESMSMDLDINNPKFRENDSLEEKII